MWKKESEQQERATRDKALDTLHFEVGTDLGADDEQKKRQRAPKKMKGTVQTTSFDPCQELQAKVRLTFTLKRYSA
jgi:hypothetical protein